MSLAVACSVESSSALEPPSSAVLPSAVCVAFNLLLATSPWALWAAIGPTSEWKEMANGCGMLALIGLMAFGAMRFTTGIGDSWTGTIAGLVVWLAAAGSFFVASGDPAPNGQYDFDPTVPLILAAFAILAIVPARLLGLAFARKEGHDTTPWQFTFRTFAGLIVLTAAYSTFVRDWLGDSLTLKALNAIANDGNLIEWEVLVEVAVASAIVAPVIVLTTRGPYWNLGVGAIGAFGVAPLLIDPILSGPTDWRGTPAALGAGLIAIALAAAPWTWFGFRSRWNKPLLERAAATSY